ncbi:hypothetical protein [Thermus brockianus]|uniref:Uncharacterized protein n=1 Tax=Thermus brockianus TaxID=56956 RepID=A0ABN6NMN0_THEBO|nr:hypothetical protein [Thermus brockianus]BDG17697.1 hypothetical protein TbrSNM41_24310 [Thermus brockianus]
MELVVDRSKDTEKVARLAYAILVSGSDRRTNRAWHYRPEASKQGGRLQGY